MDDTVWSLLKAVAGIDMPNPAFATHTYLYSEEDLQIGIAKAESHSGPA
jgi:hypothetical protein